MALFSRTRQFWLFFSKVRLLLDMPVAHAYSQALGDPAFKIQLHNTLADPHQHPHVALHNHLSDRAVIRSVRCGLPVSIRDAEESPHRRKRLML
jgi:hypothetical protein